ncbi:MAG TPA: PAS domain S-box protein [Terriglobia bacterium]|nr:PAS domain S-box protein [Terriglobia bacterium]
MAINTAAGREPGGVLIPSQFLPADVDTSAVDLRVLAAWLFLVALLSWYYRRQHTKTVGELMERQQAIVGLKEYAQEIVQSIPAGILVLSGTKKVLSANQSFLNTFGLERVKVEGRGIEDILTFQESPLTFDGTFWATLLSGPMLASVSVAGRPDFHCVRLTLNPMGSPIGEPRSILAIEDLTESERLRAAVESSERRLSDIVQSVDAIVWELSAGTGRFTFVSQRAEELLGHPVSKWIQGPEFGVPCVYPADRTGFREVFLKALREGSDQSGDFRTLTFNGREVWLRNIIRAVKDEAGRTVRLRGVMVDITEHRQAERALQRSEELFSKAFHASPAAMCLSRIEDGRFLNVNDSLLRMLGCRREEVVGFTSSQVGLWKDPSDRERMIQSLLTHRSVRDYAARLRTRNGEILEALISAEMIELENDPCLLATIQDVTEKKRSEQALRESEVRKSAILESALDAIITLDFTGHILEFNSAAEKTFGRLREEVLGENASQVIFANASRDDQPFDLANPAAWSDPSLRGKRFEIVARRADASPFPAELAITSVELRGRSLITIYLRDLTERKALEKQLWHSQKLEAVGRLAGGVAHDFNNILTVIDGYSDLLLMDMPEGAPARRGLEEIRKAGERAASLTRQLLAFSRRQVLAPQVMDLNDVIGNVNKMLRRLIGEDIELVTVLRPGISPVKADPGQIEQVLVNLVVNARDALPQGGVLSVETESVEFNESVAGRHAVPIPPGEYVMLAVADNGCGMDAETQSHIFEPFFTTKEQGKGTGLGLATVYGIVKQSGGFIWVYSEPGQGSTFKVYLPAVRDAAPSGKSVPKELRPAGGPETVLLVEDEDALRFMVREVLSAAGYNVLEATEGDEALEIARRHERAIDLMLTDIVMPRMNGQELAQKLEGLHPETRVLFMSGYTGAVVVRHGILSSDEMFIQKPFNPSALMKKVREILDASPKLTLQLAEE